jgi:hypothetical protein
VAKAATAKRERKEKLEDLLVVDCDVHVHESPGAIMPYCEMPWKKALETIKDVQVLPGYPGLLAGDDPLRGEVPIWAGGYSHGPHRLPDA